MPNGSTQKPLMIELFAGLHGWGEGGLAEGYRVVGFDIVDMCKEIGHKRPEGIELVLQDVLTLHGSQFRNAAVIVASPPCQAYSYRAMPWKRAKALPPPSNELFEACFRIQREAIRASRCRDCEEWTIGYCDRCQGTRHQLIPLVVENVKGAQPWVGRAKWHYGSFYLWGDVPALMPSAKVFKVPGFNFYAHEKGIAGGSFQSAAVKVASLSGRRTDIGNGKRFTSRDCGIEGLKRPGRTISAGFNNWPKDETGAYVMPDGSTVGGGKHFARRFEDTAMSRVSSRSHARKAASAQIAKIPLPLSQHIARVFKPDV